METARADTAGHGFTLLIVSISLAAFMTALDGTIVYIALPTISKSFDLPMSTVSWVATIYLIVISGCIPIFGKISDMIGFKKVFLRGFLIFSAGSLFCGLLPDLLGSVYVLIGFRAFQAVGAAMIAAIGPAMVTAFLPMDQKGKAMGIVLMFSGLGTAIGPSIGGVLCQFLSWNWIFFINVPVGIAAILLGAKVIPKTEAVTRIHEFDRAGAALIFVGLASLLFALSEGQTFGWTDPVILVAFALAIITFGGFVLCELRVPDPMLELRLFTQRNFLMTNAIIALIFFSYGGVNYLLPFALEYVHGYGPSAAGLIMTSFSVAMMLLGLLAGALYNRAGGRLLCILGGISLVAGDLLLTQIRVDSPTWFFVVFLALIGTGIGLMLTPASNMIMNSVGRRYQGMVSGFTIVERFAPMTMGIAVFNLVFIQGVNTISTNNEITRLAPVNILMKVLTAGFDLAFLCALVIGIVILILAILARQETHPDYLEVKDGSPMQPGMK